MIDYNQIPNRLNERIRFIRNKHEYTQKEIAEFLNVDRATYAKYESGSRAIPVEAIKVLASIYSLSSDFILGISAKEQHVDYSNYQTKLSNQATEKLQNLSNICDMCTSGINALLESRYAYKILYFLGLLLKFPNNYDDLLMNSESDTLKYGMLLEYKNDFTETLNIPTGMFGIKNETLWIIDDIYAPDAFEKYLYIYLNKFINEIRESPETKKFFLDELKRTYYEDVKKDIADMEEYYKKMAPQDFDNKTD